MAPSLVRGSLPATAAAVATTALVGGLAGPGGRDPWYTQLHKPSFQPPATVFPVVWTILYVDIAVSSAAVVDGARRRSDPGFATAFEVALGANLAFNAAWSWIFFRGHRTGAAAVTAGALAVSSIDLARRASTVNGPAAAGLGLYAAWCTFATVLATAVWRRNR